MACSVQVCEHTYTRCCHNVVVATHLLLLLLLLALRAGGQSQLFWQVEDGAADELHVLAAVLPGRVLHAAVLERYVADLTGARGDLSSRCHCLLTQHFKRHANPSTLIRLRSLSMPVSGCNTWSVCKQ
jgi:hypothetical protein